MVDPAEQQQNPVAFLPDLRFGDPDFIVHCFSVKGELVMRPYLDTALHSAGLETHTNVTNTSQAAVI